MNDLVLKYNQLNENGKVEINDFLDFLLLTKKEENPIHLNKNEKYWNKIQKVSIWSDDDIKELNERISFLNNWNIEKW